MHEPSIKAAHIRAKDVKTPLMVLHVFERDRKPVGFVGKVDTIYGGAISRVLDSADFHGRKDETLVLYPQGESTIQRVLLVGVGKSQDHTVESVRRGVGTAIRVAERMGISDVSISVGHVHHLSERMGNYNAGLAAVQAALLAAWDFRQYKTVADDAPAPTPIDSITLVAHDEKELAEFERAVEYGRITARATNFARDLQSQPGNVATPAYLGDAAKKMGDANGVKVTVLDKAAIEKEGMKALLAVAQGSAQEPRFIIMEYSGGAKNAKPLVLIGKGITFDTGGISIKPADRMEEMKYDMSGAAAVIAAMQGIAQLKLKINVVGLVASAENMPSGTALKPGDVIGSHLGKTIEIVNTDAEGRLVLADALSYASKLEPAAMVDAATLTGACVVALGFHAAGLMGTDGDLMDELKAAGVRVGERCWPLPLWDEYKSQIDSNIADVKNSGGRAAGSITAGWFLKEFAGTTPWAHLDIAGTAYREEPTPYLRKGATGLPTRLFIEWVRARAEA